LAPHRSGSRSSGDRTPARQEHLAPSKAAGVATQTTGGPSLLTPQPSANFIKVIPAAKLSLVQDIVKSWDLVIPGASIPPKGTKEEIAVAKVFGRGVRAVAECRRLEGLVARNQWRCERLQADLDACEAE